MPDPATEGVLAVDQAGLAAAADGFHAAAEAIAGVLASLRSALGAAAATPDLPDADAAWGDDRAGTAFASGTPGSPGYRARAQEVLDALSVMAGAVDGVGEALAGTGWVVGQADENAASGLASVRAGRLGAGRR